MASSAEGWARTSDILFVGEVLYPTELLLLELHFFIPRRFALNWGGAL